MRIVFVRHGEPDYVHDCLTEKGRMQALAAAERLREEGIGEIWSSPLGRAAETAEAASKALSLPVRTPVIFFVVLTIFSIIQVSWNKSKEVEA